jgi:hypothetical protein
MVARNDVPLVVVAVVEEVDQLPESHVAKLHPKR